MDGWVAGGGGWVGEGVGEGERGSTGEIHKNDDYHKQRRGEATTQHLLFFAARCFVPLLASLCTQHSPVHDVDASMKTLKHDQN